MVFRRCPDDFGLLQFIIVNENIRFFNWMGFAQVDQLPGKPMVQPRQRGLYIIYIWGEPAPKRSSYSLFVNNLFILTAFVKR